MENQTENRSEKITRLVQEWLKSGNDVIPDVLKNALHDYPDITPRSRRILERYRESALELHFHFFPEREILDTHAKDYCLIAMNLAADPRELVMDSTAGIGHFAEHVLGQNAGQGQEAMLVNIYELIQMPQGVIAKFLHSPMIRLQTLDECLGLWGNAVKSMSLEFPLECDAITADRKLVSRDAVIGRAALDELPDQVVETGTQIMKTVADNDTERQRGIGKIGDKVHHARLSVFLANDSALLLVPVNLGNYRCQMFLCPDDFLSDSVERCHGK